MTSQAVADQLFSWVDPAGNTHALGVDVVMSTKDTREVSLTDHTVESGAVITDHISLRPERVEFELVVSQTPIVARDGFASGAAPITVASSRLDPNQVAIQVPKSRFKPGGFLALTAPVADALSSLFGTKSETPTSFQGSRSVAQTVTKQVQALRGSSPFDPVNDVHDTLVNIMQTGLLVTVSFRGRIYPDYLLEMVSLSQGKGEYGLGRFSVRARAFRAVTGVAIDLPDPEDFRALPQVPKGAQATKTPDPDPADTKTTRGSSLSAKLLGIRNN